jgi:predicted lipoprotein with Yx(FWY)xxD motif
VTHTSTAGLVTKVSAVNNDKLGMIVTDQDGRTLYRFDHDSAHPSVTNCTGECSTTWPPALVSSANISTDAVDAVVLGTVTRPDGSKQLTIGGWPVYYYSGDKAPGDINGQDVSGTWYAVTPTGGKATANGASDATLSAAESDTLGPIVIDADGFTMYRFDKDSAHPSKSNCTGACATVWPPEIVTSSNISLSGINPSMVGSVTRPDGSKQLTIGGWPIYGYSGDKNPGDVNGQGVEGAWYAITPTGGKATSALATPASTPATSSSAGSGGYGY